MKRAISKDKPRKPDLSRVSRRLI